MSFLDRINGTVKTAFAKAGEEATHTDGSGTGRQIVAVRFQTNAPLTPGPQAFEDEGPYLLVQEYEVRPEEGDSIQFPDEDAPKLIRSVTKHLHGYLRVTLTDQ